MHCGWDGREEGVKRKSECFLHKSSPISACTLFWFFLVMRRIDQ